MLSIITLSVHVPMITLEIHLANVIPNHLQLLQLKVNLVIQILVESMPNAEMKVELQVVLVHLITQEIPMLNVNQNAK